MMNSQVPGRLDGRQRVVHATVWTIVHFLLWAVLFFAALFVVPRYVQRFEDFDTDLPRITVLVIDVSWLVQGYWYAALLLGLVALVLDWLVLSSLGKLGWIRVMIVGVLFALPPLLLGAIGFLAIRLAWLKLVEDLTMV